MEAFLYATVVLVVGRLFWYESDGPRNCHAMMSSGAIQAAAILAALESSNWVSSILVLFSTLGLALLTRVESLWRVKEQQMAQVEEAGTGGAPTRGQKENPLSEPAIRVRGARHREIGQLLFRLSSLMIGVLALACAAADGGLSARAIVVETFKIIASNLVFRDPLLAVHWSTLWARVLGLVLCLLEASLVVRLALAVAKVSPTTAVESKFKHSGVVGYVERWLVFVFTQYQAFNAIAFILTAKSVVRLHDTTDPDSAEYVLVGTLCSTIVAIGIGLLINLAAG